MFYKNLVGKRESPPYWPETEIDERLFGKIFEVLKPAISLSKKHISEFKVFFFYIVLNLV